MESWPKGVAENPWTRFQGFLQIGTPMGYWNPWGKPTECDRGILEKGNMNRRTERGARLSQVEEMKEEAFQDSRDAWEVGMLPPAVWTNTEWVTGSEQRFRQESSEGQTPV